MRLARTSVRVALSMLVLAGWGCSDTQTQQNSKIGPEPIIGVEPPEVAAEDWLNTDSPPTLASLQGKVVLVEFWATWCGPCVAGIPHLNELQTKYRAAGLRVISLTDENRAKVEAFQKSAKSPIKYTVGVGSGLSAKYGVTGIPHSFLVGRSGKLLWQGHPAECESKIEAALQEK